MKCDYSSIFFRLQPPWIAKHAKRTNPNNVCMSRKAKQVVPEDDRALHFDGHHWIHWLVAALLVCTSLPSLLIQHFRGRQSHLHVRCWRLVQFLLCNF